jgi:uncharacterized protein YcfL
MLTVLLLMLFAGCRVQQQHQQQHHQRLVHAAAAPEGINAEAVADMIAALPLDDQRECLQRGCSAVAVL